MVKEELLCEQTWSSLGMDLRKAVPQVDFGYLGLRTDPSSLDNIIAKIDPGTIFTVDINHWSTHYVFAYYEQMFGWVDGDSIMVFYNQDG